MHWALEIQSERFLILIKMLPWNWCYLFTTINQKYSSYQGGQVCFFISCSAHCTYDTLPLSRYTTEFASATCLNEELLSVLRLSYIASSGKRDDIPWSGRNLATNGFLDDAFGFISSGTKIRWTQLGSTRVVVGFSSCSRLLFSFSLFLSVPSSLSFRYKKSDDGCFAKETPLSLWRRSVEDGESYTKRWISPASNRAGIQFRYAANWSD